MWYQVKFNFHIESDIIMNQNNPEAMQKELAVAVIKGLDIPDETIYIANLEVVSEK